MCIGQGLHSRQRGLTSQALDAVQAQNHLPLTGLHPLAPRTLHTPTGGVAIALSGLLERSRSIGIENLAAGSDFERSDHAKGRNPNSRW
jgi:hypothetical protein